MNKVERKISLLWQNRDVQGSFWLCISDFKLGNLHFEVLKDPASGQYHMTHTMNPKIVVSSYDVRELLNKFFNELSLSTHSRFIPFRPHFIRYLGFMQRLKCEPMLF